MKHKTFFAILALTLIATSCLKVTKKSEVATPPNKSLSPPTPTEPSDVVNLELKLTDVLISFVGNPQPNSYDMVISWPRTRDRVRLSLDGQITFDVNTAESGQKQIFNLRGGRELTVLIEILGQESHVITSETRKEKVPEDYVFPNLYKLTDHLTIAKNRVFLMNSIVTTENFNLSIQTTKLIVLDLEKGGSKSRIQNFPLDQKAAHGSHGRNGGLIRIEALSAEGDLFLTMNSEAGGDALQGNYWGQNYYCVYGTHGYNAGRNGDLLIRIQDPKNFHPYKSEPLSPGGKIAPVLNQEEPEDYPRISKYEVSSVICPQFPSPGAAAQPGKVCLTYYGQAPEVGCE